MRKFINITSIIITVIMILATISRLITVFNLKQTMKQSIDEAYKAADLMHATLLQRMFMGNDVQRYYEKLIDMQYVIMYVFIGIAIIFAIVAILTRNKD